MDNARSQIKIDFINLEEFWDESKSYPLGILYISAVLKQNGFTNTGIVDHVCTLRKIGESSENLSNIYLQHRLESIVHERERSLADMFTYLQERQPHIILIGPITTFYLLELTDLVPRLRQKYPDQIILAGGPHFGKDPNLDQELLRTCPALDGMVVGEAEETIVEVAQQFYTDCSAEHEIPDRVRFRDSLSEIPGIVVVGKQFKERKPPNLLNLSFPDMELLEDHLGDSRKYYNNSKYRLSNRRNPVVWVSYGLVDDAYGGGNTEDDIHYFEYNFASRDYRFPFGAIIGSRGCPFHCAFCCTSATRRVHSAEQIFAEIVLLNKRYGIRLFVFFDALFVDSSRADQKRIEELCRMLSMSDIGVKYMIEIRADVICKLPDSLLRLLIKSGCVEFNLGLEKGSDRMLERMKKRITTDEHRNAVEKIRRIADELLIRVVINGTFILGGPEETKKDIRDTLVHCFSLHLDQATLYPMEVYPGTEVGAKAIEGKIVKPGLVSYLDAAEYPLYETKELSRSYLVEIKRKSEQALDMMEDLKKAMQGIERQFLPENVREEIVNFEARETILLQTEIKECLDIVLGYLKKNLNDGLGDKDPYPTIVKSAFQRVEREIEEIEKKLADKYPDYDYHCGDYYPGTLLNDWNSFRQSFERLFSSSNFSHI